MKAFALIACCFLAGTVASFAVATPPPGKGKPQSGTTTTTRGKGHAGKVALCHKTGSKTKPYVKVLVSKNSVKAHLKKGDVEPAADGSCPKPAAPTTTTTTAQTTTAAAA
jgi:hypothetical protein